MHHWGVCGCNAGNPNSNQRLSCKTLKKNNYQSTLFIYEKIFTKLLLCLACIAWASTAWADTETIDIANNYATLFPTIKGLSSSSSTDGDITTTVTSTAQNGFTVTVTPKTSGSNENRLWNSTNGRLRMYSGSLTINAPEGAVMTKVTFNVPSGKFNGTTTVGTITTSGESFTSAEWTGSSNTLPVTITKNTQINTIVIEYTGGSSTFVSAPVFTPRAGKYYAPISVSIASASTGASVYYTTDGSEPSSTSTLYSAPIALSADATIKAVAIRDGNSSEVATAAYTFGTATKVANIAAYQKVADSTKVQFEGGVTVIAQYGQALYTKDASGYMLVYGNTGQTYKTGDKIPAGFLGNKITYNCEPELSVYSTDGFQAAEGSETVTPETVQVSDIDASMFGHYVLIKGVTFSGVSGKNFTVTDASGKAAGYSSMGVTVSDTTKAYNLTAVVGSYGKTTATYQLLPLVLEDPSASQVNEVENIKAFLTLADNAKVKITGNVKVVYQNGRYLYITDATGSTLVYGDLNVKYNNGDVISNIEGSKKTNYDVPELIPTASTFVAGTAGEAVAPTTLTLEDVSQDMINSFVKVENVTLSAGSGSNNYNMNDGTIDLVCHNQFVNPEGKSYYSPEIVVPTDYTKKYTVKGFVSIYKSALQVIPVEFADASGVENINADAVKVTVAGGVITVTSAKANVYTVAGAQVAAGVESVSVPAGIYVVVSGNKATKVVVK